MPKILTNLKVPLNQKIEDVVREKLPTSQDFRILKKSVDARRRHEPHWVYSVEVYLPGETKPSEDFQLPKVHYSGEPVNIIGSGPAGLFAALRLVERGIPVRIFEQGSECGKRIMGINKYWRYGELNPRNNVCFGEGGAGLYSDGKLITRIKSPHIPYVMKRLAQFGAPEEIIYVANPHVGSDRIRRVIPKLRAAIQSQGGEFYFDTKIEDFLVRGKRIEGVLTEGGKSYFSPFNILACGHSAEDTFQKLFEHGVQIRGQSFAMGIRIEHPQELINSIQYRSHAGHPDLGAANYRLAYHDVSTNVGTYSFCMCPGGYVLSSGTDADGIVTNGMSNFNRGSPYANAAIVVTIDYEQNFGADAHKGFFFRKAVETRALNAVRAKGGTKELPSQRLTDFLKGGNSEGHASLEKVLTSSPSGSLSTRVDEILPAFVAAKLKEGIQKFDQSMKGFIDPRANVFAVESRTSCPIRIERHEQTYESPSHSGLFPCGEGSGFAGGITSAACDGIRSADSIVDRL